MFAAKLDRPQHGLSSGGSKQSKKEPPSSSCSSSSRGKKGSGTKMMSARFKSSNPSGSKDECKKALFLDDETRSMSTAQTSTLTDSIVSSIRQQQSNKGERRETYDPLRGWGTGGEHENYSSSSSSPHSLQRSHAVRPRHSRSSRSTASSGSSKKKRGHCASAASFDCLKLQGREKHFETWDESIVTDKSRQLVLLSGSSGSGKSRLAHELACPKRNSSPATSQASSGEEDGGGNSNRPTSLWTLGGKFDARHTSPYAVFSLIIEDLYDSLLPSGEGEEGELVDETDDDSGQAAVGPEPRQSAPSPSSSAPHRSSMLYSFICSRLRQSLDDEESKLLIEFVPALRDMLNVQSLDFKSDLEEREDARLEMGGVQGFAKVEIRFQRAFRKVMRGLAKSLGSVDSRLVLVFDDLQWADRASLDLIQDILMDHETSHRTQERAGGLIVVGCYRDGENKNQEAIRALVNDLQQGRRVAGRACLDPSASGVLVRELKVDHLLPQEVGSMMMNMRDISTSQDDTDSPQTDNVESVADRVYQKTAGNPFFTIEYMKALLGSGGDCAWKGDEKLLEMMDALDASMTSANLSVADVVLAKIRKLPKKVARLLPLLGSLGFTLQRSMFVQIVKHFTCGHPDSCISPKHVAEICLEEGLIEANGAEWYRWKHDTFQEATLSLVGNEGILASLQFELARFLFDKLACFELDESLFIVANLFTRGGIRDRKNSFDGTYLVEVAKFFLRAGKKAAQYSTFDLAASYLNTGIDLLPKLGCWSMYYELSLDLYSSAAQAAFSEGDYDAMQTHCDEVIDQQNCPLLDKRRVYHVMLDSVAARGTAENAASFCLELLSKLGCKIPKSSHTLRTTAGLMKVKMSIGKFKREDPSKYGVMQDPSKLWAMKLMDKLLTFLYLDGSPMIPLVILKSLRWTEKYGTSDWSMPAIASIGFMLSAFMQDFSGGETYVNRALGLQEKSRSQTALPKTYLVAYGLVLHWTTPYSVCRKHMLKGYSIGLKNGDTELALACSMFSVWFSLFSGNALERVSSDIESHLVPCQKLNDAGEQSVLITLEAIQKLRMGNIAERDLLSCASISREEVARLNLHPTLHFFQLYMDFYFADYQAVVEFIEKNGDQYFEKALPGLPMIATFVFMGAFSFLSLARETGSSKYEKSAKAYTKKIKTWVDKGNPNVVQYRALLDAEWAAFKGSRGEAMHAFNVAILMAERRGLVQDVALVHERLSGYHAETGCSQDEASEHANQAKKLYEEWGAHAVAKRLTDENPEYFGIPAQVGS
mmetsp:Transcript_107572/g.160908  ORF Transcript_107572/g.160908 Transcript_107572/m.160908 type:complete len:1276 (-) Transcript_107572:23-3850(-)|eukprot:CAMPEP_0117009246 /NCGR_PEP_ID=MMETSP0472-20121206/8454_1 /TAXON_ID=693140 ORGANISM="Tiarina fusus, Strain LIS" /NCGR_SAMPLE_ID=MMETSP0472 /ASSEMBLY_ACC=CAM_ASM_000603 /LENGTH=1275 /DNA_ID=CAMNT_0004711479 /DNA_START=207 /DNA_END=4034 /DNA_ORIENTATION=-